MKDYRTYLRAAGVKPIRGKLRTDKEPGSVEIVWDPRTRDYVRIVHEGEPMRKAPKLEVVREKRRAAA